MEYRGDFPRRWQTYDGATAEEAAALAQANSEQAWKAFRGKVAVIRRKHWVRPLERQADAAWQSTADARKEIGRLPVTGPASVAIKAALVAYHENADPWRPTTGACLESLATECVASIYRHASKEAGFNPLLNAYEAIGHPIAKRMKKKAA